MIKGKARVHKLYLESGICGVCISVKAGFDDKSSIWQHRGWTEIVIRPRPVEDGRVL
jgi:hypothetical protein